MIVHLNGSLVPAEAARISPFDRGFLFADGVYEGLRAAALPSGDVRIVGVRRHAERMHEGLARAGIAWDTGALDRLSIDLLRANGLVDAFVYWQVTRGTPPAGAPVRTRVPPADMPPTVFGFCTAQPPLEAFRVPAARSAAGVPDIRWSLGRLKSISLMGNVLLSLDAAGRHADEAIFLRDGLVAEGAATNVFIAGRDGDGREHLATPSLGSVPILAGVTRAIILDAAPDIVERPVAAEELRRATEVILTGSTTMVASVTRLDGRPVGTGAPGPHAHRLLRLLCDAIRNGTDDA